MRLAAKLFVLTIVGFNLILVPPFTHAGEPKKAKPYELSLDVRDLANILAGIPLEKNDPLACEKARDVCVVVMCGSFVRENVNQGCWKHCTERRFNSCKAEK